MVWKAAKNEWKIHRGMNILIIVQFIVTFMACICCVSIILSQLKYVWGLRNYFNQEGYYLEISDIYPSGSRNPIQNSAELESYLKSTNIIGYSSVGGTFTKDNLTYPFYTKAYDKEIIQQYQPQIIQGRWLEEMEKQTNVLEAVISENRLGIQVGDTLNLDIGDNSVEKVTIQIEIVGVIKNDTLIFGMSPTGEPEIDYRFCYEVVNYNVESRPTMVFSKENFDLVLEQLDVDAHFMELSGSAFMIYQKGITEEEKEYNLNYLEQNGSIGVIENLFKINKNNHKYVLAQIMQIFPVLFSVFILSLLSTVCTRAISAKIQLENYTIYRICGLNRSKCILINSISVVINIVIAIMVGGVLFFLFSKLFLLENTVIQIGFWQVFIGIVLFSVELLISSILPRCIIKKEIL